MSLPHIAIIELGSQYTLLIERSLRELGYRSIIMEPKRALKWLQANPVNLIILSGGFASVYDKGAPQPPEEVLTMKRPDGKPIVILGICYGMQWLAQKLGGKVESTHAHREYGPTKVYTSVGHWLFDGMPGEQDAWASHGDTVTSTGRFISLADSKEGGMAALESHNGRMLGVQFHPEVEHTVYGKRLLQNVLKMADCLQDWQASSMISTIREDILRKAHGWRSLMLYSGGVDSSVLASLAAPVLKDDLLAVTIDGGQLRENELAEIEYNAGCTGVRLRVVDATARFEALMEDTIDAEEKRKQFKTGYIEIPVAIAKEINAPLILQGTLAPDRIESGATGGDVIKSHHNVGLDMGLLMQMHPIEHLFKYEIRALARELKLPESICTRQPFPGPGLFIRTLHVPAIQENVEVTRWADARVTEVMKSHGVYDQLSQLVVAYFSNPITGVKGDKRVYEGYIAVRAVQTMDFMTAKGVHFSEQVQDDIQKVVAAHSRIVCAMFDPSDKPPRTTEFE